MPILDKSDKVQVAKYIEFLKDKENVSLTQDIGFLSANKNSNFEIVFIEKNGHFTASMAINIIPVGKKHCVLYCCKGPVCDIYDLEQVNSLIKEAKPLVAKYNAIMLIMDPEIENDEKLKKIYNKKGYKVYSKLPFDFIKRSVDNCVNVDLEEFEEGHILEKLQDKTRYNIEAAEKRNVYIKIGTTKREFDKFIKLYEQEKLPEFEDIKNFQTFKNLLKEFDDDVIRIYTASVSGQTLSAAIVCKYGNTIKCLAEVSVKSSLGIYARSKMHYEIIKWGIGNKCISYNMGQVDAIDNRFKEGFSTKLGLIEYIGKICKVYNRLALTYFRVIGGRI